ncbi:MAG: TVP38/TMEM64 family protein [Anaerolineae bacterium]|nr:TVP38/TMEM64 family protein [Anaerolineae bacterium]
MTHPRIHKLKSKLLPWIGGLLVIVVLAALWKPLSQVGADSTHVRAWIEPLGPFAPLAFFLLNVAQIVVAPIPGYPVQVLGGILFGVIPGSIYAVGGMVAGGTLAAWLGRRFGRPWLEQRMGAETLEQWGKIAHIDSFWTWWVILLIPLGDIPYFFAGLSRISLSRFALAILTSRGPFTVLIVWAGDSVVDLPLVWVALLMAVIGLIIIAGFSQRERIEAWGRAYIARQAAETEKS